MVGSERRVSLSSIRRNEVEEMKILSFGEILWDVYPEAKFIGGAPLNFAAHMAKHGHQVWMLSALGRDDLGAEAAKQLEAWGICTGYVSFSDTRETGRCLVTLSADAVPSYQLLSDVAYDEIACDQVAGSFDVLYFGTLALRSAHNRAALKKLLSEHRFGEVFVDVNLRPPFVSGEVLRFAAEQATMLKISREELGAVAQLLELTATDEESLARELSKRYEQLRCIVITRDADGAYAWDSVRRQGCACAGEKVAVVSTVGAGDSFSAAFLHSCLCGKDLESCLSYAAKVAGYVVSQYDAVPEYNAEQFAETAEPVE